MNLSLHPSVGIARLGNSTTDICLAPTEIGGLPYDADNNGNASGPISQFKDATGRVKRQGQPFSIYDENGEELTLDSPNVASIEWTVHLANKKAEWYQYSELQGNLLYGESNSYQNQDVPLRNPDVAGQARQTLFIDPGPRSISGRQQTIGFDKANAPAGYPVQYPGETTTYGVPIKTLGDLLTDKAGRLVVLGGYGNAGGDEPLTSYGGSNTWHDDISDGPVYCNVIFKDGSSVALSAWVVVGSPDFAPEIVNISNLSDTMFDVGVRCFDLVPDMCKGGAWNTSYNANFQRDILPVINRISRYQWVANVQPMMAFASNAFDYSDPSEDNLQNREAYYSYFRQADAQPPNPDYLPQEELFKMDGDARFPMMVLNSGSNSVSNVNIMKFMALNDTQLFLLGQWAKGNFTNDKNYEPYPVNRNDSASVGNCVGLPMCPGIEVTWSMQNPAVYASPYVIKRYQDESYYFAHGLTPTRDECEGGGCEPGDLTKRMACPWQADFFQCTIQYINFTDPSINKITDENGDTVPMPPTYYSYWWPPQSPWDVLVGEFTAAGQAKTNVPAGQQMNYARGINSFTQMVEFWYSLGFIRDVNGGNKVYPYLVETERNNDLFTFKNWHVGNISNNMADNETTIPVFFIEPNKDKVKKRSLKAAMLVDYLEDRAFKPIETVGLLKPRAGTRNRR